MRGWVWFGGSLVAALAVWLTAHRLGMKYEDPTGRDGGVGAPGWAMLTLLMPALAVPIYLWRRRRYLPQNRSS